MNSVGFAIGLGVHTYEGGFLFSTMGVLTLLDFCAGYSYWKHRACLVLYLENIKQGILFTLPSHLYAAKIFHLNH